MEPLPQIPDLEILSLVHQGPRMRRYRLASVHEFLWLYEDPAVAEAVRQTTRRFMTVSIDGLARVTGIVEHAGGVGVVLEGDVGDSPWSLEPIGEMRSLPLLHATASIVAMMHQSGMEHGWLHPDGVTIHDGSAVLVLPPMVLPAFLDAQIGVEDGRGAGFDGLTPFGADLSALAHLACHWIGGLKPTKAAGVGALPAALKSVASPATAQAVWMLLETAAQDPDATDSVELLNRIGWVHDVRPPKRAVTTAPIARSPRDPAPAAAPAAPPRSPERVELPRAGRAPGVPRAAEPRPRAPANAEDRPARARRVAEESRGPIPAILVACFLLVLGGGLLAIGNREALERFWSADPDHAMSLPSPEAPAAPTPLVEETTPEADPPAPESQTSAEIAADLLRDIDERNARKKELDRKARTYNRTLINEGDRLKQQAITILAGLREGGVDPKEKNEKLDQAIQFLEQAREKYDGFVEQYPDRERLVEGVLEEVNGLLFHAYRQKTQAGN